MKLTTKFIAIIAASVISIITANILAIYIFTNTFFANYLDSKKVNRESVTIDYITTVIDKETLSYIDNLFVDVEEQFYSLAEKYWGDIPLDNEENRNIVINYLIESGVSFKFIEDLIPTNKFENIVSAIKQKWSEERTFVFNLLQSIIATNILIIIGILLYIFYFTKRTIRPITEITQKLKKFKNWDLYEKIDYSHNDEVWLLVKSINSLSTKLGKQEEIRHKFLADISHELKTPITAIRCYLEGISDGVIEMNQDNLGKITDEMSRLVNLVNMIMEFEKFDNKKLNLNLKQHKIKEIIESSLVQYENLLNKNSQKIEVEGEENILNFDDERFKQVIHNIISNFLKYSGRNTTLRIKIRKNFIDFSDNWEGVRKKKIPFLTEKFYQADDSKTGDANERWIWVGLSIVEKIVKEHWWNMRISSDEGLGFGIRIFTKSSH